MYQMGRYRLIAALSFACGFGVVTSAQKDLPVPKSTPSDQEVTISGCVRGTRVVPLSSSAATISDTLQVSEFVLEGPKDVLQSLRKEHNGHQEEVTGIAHLPATPSDARTGVATTSIGKKGRVTVGQRQESGGVRPAPPPARLRVASVRHVSDGCASRRN